MTAFKGIDVSRTIKGVEMAVGIFYLWIYTSQYIKTCVLLPSMTKKANLLIQSFHTTVDYESTKLTSEVLKRNKEIDKAIQNEKRRFKIINRYFMVLDILVGVAFQGLIYFLENKYFPA